MRCTGAFLKFDWESVLQSHNTAWNLLVLVMLALLRYFRWHNRRKIWSCLGKSMLKGLLDSQDAGGRMMRVHRP